MLPVVTPPMKNSISSRDRFCPSLFFLMTSCGLKLLSLVALHKNSGLSRHSQPLPYRVESLACLGLYTHASRIDSQHACDILAHRVDITSEFWPFEQDYRINIDYMETAFARQPHHTRKQFQTVRTTPLWIFVREMNSQITFTKRAENRVGNRMTQSVCIGMTFCSPVRCYVDTAQHKLSSFDEPVCVSANTDSNHIYLLCAPSGFSVSLWLLSLNHHLPQRHRGRRG